MPLSPPSTRELVHTRKIECRGYHREDGLWDIEGHLIDTKPKTPNESHSTSSDVSIIHDMWLRLTIDNALMVHAAEAVMDRSPYRICPEIAPNFDALAGVQIKPGWRREANRRVGGVKGCTHLVELLDRWLQSATKRFMVVARPMIQTKINHPVQNMSLPHGQNHISSTNATLIGPMAKL